MLCDDCEKEPCRCSKTVTSYHDDRDSSGSEQSQTDPKPRPRLRHRVSKKPLGEYHTQPQLSVRTQGLGVSQGEDTGGSAVVGGRFSPESFKQRVLRKMGS
jgi:hypothetical protein